MKKEIADEWVAALRSGKYKQAKSMLSTAGGESFCCLGVLCDLHQQTSEHGEWLDNQFNDAGDECRHYEIFDRMGGVCESDYGTLPQRVVDWAGVKDGDPVVNVKGVVSLSEWNDKGGTFEQIADYIEANYESL